MPSTSISRTICVQILTNLQQSQTSCFYPSKDLIFNSVQLLCLSVGGLRNPAKFWEVADLPKRTSKNVLIFFLKQRKTTLMRRWKTNEKRNDDVEIGNNKTFCFDGWDNAVTSTLDIAIFEKWTSNKATKIGQGREHVRGLARNKACVGHEHRIGNVRLITLWKVFDMNLPHSWHTEKKKGSENNGCIPFFFPKFGRTSCQ